MSRPARARRAPERYSPGPGRLDDDYASDQYDSDVSLDASDVTSVATSDDEDVAADVDLDADLPGFVVPDDDSVEEDAELEDSDEESEWDSTDDDVTSSSTDHEDDDFTSSSTDQEEDAEDADEDAPEDLADDATSESTPNATSDDSE